MPLTERQQLAYLLSMTAKESKGDGNDSRDDISSESRRFKKSRLSPISRIDRPKNKNGETSLHLAATKGDLETTKSLVKQGADVNCKDNAGNLDFLSDKRLVSFRTFHQLVLLIFNCTLLHIRSVYFQHRKVLFNLSSMYENKHLGEFILRMDTTTRGL